MGKKMLKTILKKFSWKKKRSYKIDPNGQKSSFFFFFESDQKSS